MKKLAEIKARLAKATTWVSTHSTHILCTIAIICSVVCPPLITRELAAHDRAVQRDREISHNRYVNACEALADTIARTWFSRNRPRTKLEELRVFGVEAVGSHWECFVEFTYRGKKGKVIKDLHRFKAYPSEKIYKIMEV